MNIDAATATELGFYPGVEVNPGKAGCVALESTDTTGGGCKRGDIIILTVQEARDMAEHILATYPAPEQIE